MARQTPVLQCSACGHENEPERVYCHNCGQKLDRSLLPKAEEKAGESDAQRQRRVKRMMSVRKGWLGRDVKTLFSVLIFAALVAAVFLYFQAPEGVPPRNPETLPLRSAGETWEALMSDKRAIAVELTEADVNHHLSSVLKPTEGGIPGVKFQRTFMKFEPGTITVAAERNAWGLPMYSSTTYAPRNVDGKVSFEVVGVHFGRLAVDPRVPYIPGLGLGAVRKAFDKQFAQLGRLQHVEVRKGAVRITTQAAP